MLARLGRVLYWAALVFIAGLFIFCARLRLDAFSWLFVLIIAGLIWGLGRACRYVLANE